jgi:hypothetical protein
MSTTDILINIPLTTTNKFPQITSRCQREENPVRANFGSNLPQLNAEAGSICLFVCSLVHTTLPSINRFARRETILRDSGFVARGHTKEGAHRF